MIIKLNPDSSGIAKGVDAIQECLTKFGLKRKDITKAMLVSEEVMASLLVHHTKEKEMQLSIRRFLGDITIEISVPGESFDFTESMEFGVPLEADNLGHETEITIRNIILKSFADDLKYKHQHGLNMVRLNVVKSKHALLYRTMGAMFLAIILGIIFKSMASDTFNNILNTNILVPVKTMFMNALKMVVTPVVFFSIVSCISQFGSLSEMGKIGGKVLSFYLFTTVIATGLGIAAFICLNQVIRRHLKMSSVMLHRLHPSRSKYR